MHPRSTLVLIAAAVLLAGCAAQKPSSPQDPATSTPASSDPAAPAAAEPRNQGEPAITLPPDAPPPQPAGAGRPVWWVDQPLIEGGFISLCAEAQDKSMIAARTKALAAAREDLARRTSNPPIEEATKIEVSPLSDGSFRVFVRLTARL